MVDLPYGAPAARHRAGPPPAHAVRLFGTEDAAEAWFAESRWGGEPACPSCRSVNVQVGAKHPTMRYRCRACRKFFSVKTGTAMQHSKLSLRTWAVGIHLMAAEPKGPTSVKLHRDLGITRKAGWHLAHRLREAWDAERSNRFGNLMDHSA